MHGPLDVISPDALTIGHGKTTGLMNGGYSGHSNMFEYEGESDSTYAALTWDIPSFNDEPMSREERHTIREQNLAAEAAVTKKERVVLDPPPWLPYGIFGGLALMLIGVWFKSRKQDPWN